VIYSTPKPNTTSGNDLWVVPMEDGIDRTPVPYLVTAALEQQAQFSPDGRFVAYGSDQSGPWEIYVQPFPNASDGKWMVSSGGGVEPRWSRDGKELFYFSGQTLMAVPVSLQPTFSTGPPAALFDAPVQAGYTSDSHRWRSRRRQTLSPAGKRRKGPGATPRRGGELAQAPEVTAAFPAGASRSILWPHSFNHLEGHTMRRTLLTIGFALGIAICAGVVSTMQTPGAAIAIDGDDLAGTVTGPAGPEAGVWVIAETSDLPTPFAKIVVTDDQGRYLIPDLPAANYSVWVRGYGLVDSPKTQTTRGKTLDLKAVPASSPAAAAQYYPAAHWLALMEIPAKSESRAPATAATASRT
jgi:hypothetical protein